MQYFALLISREPDLAPDERAEMMAAFERLHAKAGKAIRAGDALTPAATAVRIAGGPDAPVITDGPFAEGAEVACGYYVLEAENLDEALAFAREIPVATYGAVEVWPAHSSIPDPKPLEGPGWIALIMEPQDSVTAPGTPERQEWSDRQGVFQATAGDHVRAGWCLHPPSTATTVRVRDGEALITDGPYVEGAEVASGFYLLGAADRDEATKLASMIPGTAVELRQLAGVSHL